MLEKVRGMFQQGSRELPRHVAISTSGIEAWAAENKKSLQEANQRGFENILLVLREQISRKIPVVTFFILREDMDREAENFRILIDSIVEFFSALKNNEDIHANRVKVSIIGKWYNLPGRVVDPVKEVVEATRDYSSYYLNFCINYDGQEEIADAYRLIAKQIESGKITAESISKELVKSNLYTSYFPQVGLLIKNGEGHSIRGFLLWDSYDARIYFSNKLWPDFTKGDFEKALNS